MKRYLVLIFVVLMGLYLVFAFASGEKMTDMKNLDLGVKKQEINSMGTVKPDIDFGKIPLYFITNKGQVNEKAKFYAKASRYTLWLTKEGLVFDSIKKTHPAPAGHPSQEGNNKLPYSSYSTHSPKIDRDVSQLIFLEANQDPEMVPVEEAKLRVNYFIGNDKSQWHCDIPTSRAVLYKNLYKNIDLKVYGLEKQIEYDWIVKPGGNPGDIRFHYKNIKGTRIDDEGDLIIETEFGKLIHKKPVCYQRRGLIYQTRNEIPGWFKKISANTYGFEVGAYDRSRELIIDPVVLAYSTYLGGGGYDEGAGSTHVITWTNEGTVGDVNIEYSIDSGNSWIMIELSAVNSGSYNWIVPDTPSNNCLVRISGVDTDEAPMDVSDAVFSII